MKYFAEDKDDLYTTVFSELKHMGVKVPKVKKFKSHIPKQDKALTQPKSKIFGVSLADQEWTSDSNYYLPKFIASSLTFLQNYTQEVGLFRKAGSKARQRDLRLKLEKGECLEGSEPNDVASLLKQWLRELPEPLIPQYMHELFVRCQQLESDETRTTANLLACLLLPTDHLHTLKYLLCFLADFAANSDKNMMGSHNLALIMAPNIFVMGADSVDKTSSNTVQVHASVIQLLIENAKKIGDVPASVSFQCSLQEGKSCSELDSSGDILDTSPYKTRKKIKSGHVQDLFSGIRKLVGQNTTPGTSLKTPEKFWNSHTSAPRCASKRKADPDLQSLSPLKKQTKSVNEQEDICLTVTPKQKGFGTVGRSGGHTRKKSFGLLRRKERKRQKSFQGGPQPTVTVNVISPQNSDEQPSNVALVVKDHVKDRESSPENLISAFDRSFKKLTKSESIKKSTSDCYLMPKFEKVQRLSLPSSSFRGCENKLETPPYYLRSAKSASENGKSAQKEAGSSHLEVMNVLEKTETHKSYHQTHKEHIGVEITANQESSSKTSRNNTLSVKPLKHSKENESPQRPYIVDLKTGEITRITSHKTSKTQRTGSHGKTDYSDAKTSLSLLNNRSSPETKSKDSRNSDSPVKRNSIKVFKRSPNADRPSQKGGLSRQEAFIVKSKKQLKSSFNQLENIGNETKKIDDQNLTGVGSKPLRKSHSVTLGMDEMSKFEKKVTKRSTRNGSIIRGRPNTVKSGLRVVRSHEPDPTSPGGSCESKLCINTDDKENETARKNPSNKSPSPIRIPEADRVFKNASQLDDISLNLKFENFSLSSPTNASDNLMDFINNMFSTEDKCSPQRRSEIQDVSMEESESSVGKLPRRSQPKRSSVSNDSKIPRLRDSLEVARKNSFPEIASDPKRKISKSRGSNSSDSSHGSSKIPVRSSKEDSFNLSSLQVSMNDSCFKTPDKNAFLSPNSVTWMSGSKYLAVPSPQDETYNKRESIALILRNNPGHVQAKVSMYDTRGRDTVVCTKSVPSFSTPSFTFNFCEDQSSSKRTLRSSQKCHPDSQKSHKTLYASKSCDSADRISHGRTRAKHLRSPLAPPPKFDPVEIMSPPTMSDFQPSKIRTDGLKPSRSPSNDISVIHENISVKQPSGGIHPSKEVTNVSLGMETTRSPMNLSINDESNTSKRLSENPSHPLKEVTNISFGLNTSQSSMNTSNKEENRILKRFPENNLNSSRSHKRLKRNSFTTKSTKKRTKKVSRSESSPGRPRPCDKTTGRGKNLTSKSASIILETNFQNEYLVPKHKLLRSSISKSGSSLSIEKLRSDQLIDEWEYEV